MSSSSKAEATPKMPQPGPSTKDVLHQRRSLPYCPARMAVGGFAIAAAIGYLTLLSKKKPEVTALDVARVATTAATPNNNLGK
ncbi:hypothetical protein U1Q18_018296 [Sarracenia purpurea var. burkii]